MLVILMYNCGFEGLRGLFIKKHPHWRNSKKDIENFKRGSLHLEHFEKEPFNSGNIYTWDVSLLSKVLLKSDSRNMLNEEEIHAVECLRDIKNKLISHCSNIEVSEKEFEDYMSSALHSLMTIGVSEERLTVALNDSELSEDNLHYKMYRDELDGIKHSVKALKEEVDANTRNIQALVNAIKNREIPQNKIPEQAQKHDPANWNLWLKVKKELNNFDDENNHYLLIVDKITSSDAQYLTALGKIPWKLVLDLDPDSDDNGLFRHISPHHENSGVIVTHTPSQLKHIDFKSIDLKRVNWVFANGRNKDADEDAPKSDHTDWRKYFKIPIFNMIKQFKKKLERRKPTFCIILNIGDSSRKVAMSLAQEIDEQFFSEESTFKNVLFSSNIDTRDFINPFFHSVLSTKFLFFGIHAIVGSQNKVYTLPTSQEDAPSPLENKKFHFLSEYFEILYKGCQNIPTNLSDEEKRKFENDHLKSFLKGNLISFESLSYSHDCQRTITKSIATRIRKILQQKESTPQIVQILHSPGTGGSTIGRRVLWDLHEEYPCAIVKMQQASENIVSEYQGEKLISKLSERVGEIEDMCELKPIILVDGNTRQVRNISDQLVRKLNVDGKKTVVLRVVHPQGNEKENDSYFQEKSNFEVKSVLKDDKQDLVSFQEKYTRYIEIFKQSKADSDEINKLTRVFHFPMMAMLEEFEKLQPIVKDSLDILQNDHAFEYEVAILVAFLQIYANRETPKFVIEKYLKRDRSSSEESKRKFSESLLCLMVSKKARSQGKWIGYKDDGFDDDISSHETIDTYTFQHYKVAEIVINHSTRNLDEIAERFVKKLVDDYRHLEYRDLVDELFLYKKNSSEDHFSHLVMNLEKDGRILTDAAQKLKDATFYSHVARYYAIMKEPLDFKKARELINEGLEVDKYAKREKKRGVWNAEGYIMLWQMKANGIKSVDNLKKHAKEAIASFKKARDNPPMTYPNPLLGEVNVLQFCFDWIIRWKKRDVKMSLKYMAEDDFFCQAPGDCFFLLDKVDEIVQSVPSLVDAAHTSMLANDCRSSLIRVFGTAKGSSKTGRAASVQFRNVPQMCKEIAEEYFKTANEKEITRLTASWLINEVGKKLDLLDDIRKAFLLNLLKKLVNQYEAYEYASYLMYASSIQDKLYSFTLAEALDIVKKWQIKRENDASAFFYEYIIRFLGVLNGSVFENHSPFERALSKCIQLSESNHKRHQKQCYIAKNRVIGKMCCLISREQLEKLCEEDREKQKDIDQNHLKRKYLRECQGRLRSNLMRGKDYPFIALEQGNLRIGVQRNSVGKPHQDYTPNSKVNFIVSFTLSGPMANDIRFMTEKSAEVKQGKHSESKKMAP